MVELNEFNGSRHLLLRAKSHFVQQSTAPQFIGHHPLARAQDHCVLASAATPSASPAASTVRLYYSVGNGAAAGRILLPSPTRSLSKLGVPSWQHLSLHLLTSGIGIVSRVTPVHTALRNCTRDEGRPFEFGNQVLISSHRKLLSSKAMVVNVAEKSELDFGRYD